MYFDPVGFNSLFSVHKGQLIFLFAHYVYNYLKNIICIRVYRSINLLENLSFSHFE